MGDNNFYKAQILRKTSLGYQVRYTEYNEIQDLPIAKIKKLPQIYSTSTSTSTYTTRTMEVPKKSKHKSSNCSMHMNHVTEKPMDKGWTPSKRDKDLTSHFSRPDGTCSVRQTMQKLQKNPLKDTLPRDFVGEEFYLYSTGQKS